MSAPALRPRAHPTPVRPAPAITHSFDTNQAGLKLVKSGADIYWFFSQNNQMVCLHQYNAEDYSLILFANASDMASYTAKCIDDVDVWIHTVEGRNLYLAACERNAGEDNEDEDEPAAVR